MRQLPVSWPIFGRVVRLFITITLATSACVNAQEKLVDVIVQAATQQKIHSNIEALGTLRANESITLTPNVTKTITRINFDDGERVHKGQVLVEMTSAEETALLNEAKFNADEAKKQLDRVRALAKSGAASQSLLDQQERGYQAAEARYNAVASRLQDLRLIAPFSGVIGLRNVSVGALVSPGQQITTLNDDNKMKLDFTVPALHLRSLHPGLPIVAQSAALGEKQFHGSILSLDNQIDPVTRAIKVRALLDNADHQLKQGMLLRVDLRSAERDAVIISEAALEPLGSNNFVYLLTQQQGNSAVLERRQIVIGQRYPGVVEVISGLAAGDKVVTHGLQKIRTGQKITILAEEEPASFSVANKGEHISDLLEKQSKPAAAAQ